MRREPVPGLLAAVSASAGKLSCQSTNVSRGYAEALGRPRCLDGVAEDLHAAARGGFMRGEVNGPSPSSRRYEQTIPVGCLAPAAMPITVTYSGDCIDKVRGW